MTRLSILYTTFIVLLSIVFLGAQELQVQGTPLFLDYSMTGLSASDRNSRMLVNEENESFLFVEIREMSIEEYEEAEPQFFRIEKILHEEKLLRKEGNGKLKKSVATTEGPERILWFAYLPIGDVVVDIKGGYERRLDDQLGPLFQKALRSIRVDSQTTGQHAAGLPVHMDGSKWGYQTEPTYMPNSKLWKKRAEEPRLITINWYSVEKGTQPELSIYEDELHHEVVPLENRIITWTWRTGAEVMEMDAPVFEATIYYPDLKVLVLGHGVYSTAYLEELKEMTRSLERL